MPRTKKEVSQEEQILSEQNEGEALIVQDENLDQGALDEPDTELRDERVAQVEGEETTPVDSEEELPVHEEREEKLEVVTEEDSGGTKLTLRTRKTRQVVTIDDHRTVASEADLANEKLLDLVESLKAGRILTGTVQGVERMDSGKKCCAVLYHGDYRILIPDTEFLQQVPDLSEKDPAERLYSMAVHRLGAEIDYVVQGIDPDNLLAVASRLKAMQRRSRRMYRQVTESGDYWVRPGKRAEARVVAVLNKGIFVDVLGVETFIPVEELSYQRIWNAQEHYRPGQRILVRILDIDRTDLRNIQVTCSAKQAADNPFSKAARKYAVGNCYVGTVSMVNYHGVFVALDGGVDCLCGYPARGRPPRNAQVMVRISGIDYETGRIWGIILHVSALRLEG